jgi:hypothetical protein
MSAEGNLVTRLLTRGEEAGEPGSRQVRHQLEEKGRLAEAIDPGLDGSHPVTLQAKMLRLELFG